MEQQFKYHKLINYIRGMENLAVAFSGGVDSTFLLKVAYDELKEKAAAVTVVSAVLPEKELHDARDFCDKLGIKHIIIRVDEMKIEGFKRNPPDRCYLCKRFVFKKVMEEAAKEGIMHVADGSNIDDLGDFRPGMKALSELGIVSPLREAGLNKNDIRYLSRELGLSTWDKPAYACLATRIPYGEEITREKLEMIGKAEDYLKGLGFGQLRVRYHAGMARIEVHPSERSRFFDMGFMDKIDEKFREIGFSYAALDLRGYRTGSMNEVLKPD